MMRFVPPLAAAALLLAAAAQARTLEVGPGKQFNAPSAAVAAAGDGDKIAISPGQYFDCAVITKNNLTLEGVGAAEQVVLTDKACEGKALLVTRAEGVTVRNLTLTRVRVPDQNGAGIRGEGHSLLVDRVRFINNQNGILSGTTGGSMTIRDSLFEKNGSCDGACAHGIYVTNLDLLRIEHSRFFDTKRAHHIKSRARRTEVLNSDIQDGPEGTASYEIEIPNGGSLVARGNTIVKGPNAENHTAAIMIGSEGVTQPTPEIVVENNTFRNDGSYPTIFVDNLTATEAQLSGNRISGNQVTALKGDGPGRRRQVRRPARALLAACLLAGGPAAARTLAVGPGQDFASPSAAIAAAADGDTVRIAPGEYFDCAIVQRNRLTIEGDGEGAVLTDKACEGKALLVIRAEGVVVRNLTLARARVPDGNGAGIRLEGAGLLLQRVTFDNDQVGLLSGAAGGEIRIEDCRFQGGGVGEGSPTSAVMVASPALLRIERSSFEGVRGGQVSSAAERTELRGNAIATGAGDGPAEAALAGAGALLLEDNVLTVGPNAPRRGAAVTVMDGATATLRRNRLVNQTGRPLALLLDWSWGDPVLEANQVGPGDSLLSSAGQWRHRASVQYHERKDQARALAGQLKRFVQHYVLAR